MDQRKVAFFLPNIFTALNMGCGYTGILFASQGKFYHACMIIGLGALFDMVDGRVARLTGTQSAFGEQFDSLSDLISFGIAPAMVFYYRFLADTGRVGIVISFIYVLCGALRLARFNANLDKVSSEFFQGVPIPGAAMATIGFVLLSLEVSAVEQIAAIPIVYLLFYAVLMISNIPFPSFKNSQWIKAHKKQTLFMIFVIIASFFLKEELMIAFWITFYVLCSILYYLTHREKFQDVFNWKNEDE